MSRTWNEHDRVAIRDRVDQQWRLGTITGAGDEHLIIRVDGGTCATVRHRDDERVIPADEVPVDERRWLPQQVRDQLVRQEAAGRLRVMSDCLVGAGMTLDAIHIDGIADRLGDPTDAAAPLHLALAARALLNPAPAPTP